jgi:hypothetical protein
MQLCRWVGYPGIRMILSGGKGTKAGTAAPPNSMLAGGIWFGIGRNRIMVQPVPMLLEFLS